MNAQAWIGLGGVTVMIASTIITPLFVVFFRMGKSAAALESLGKEIDTLKVKTDAHANSLAALTALLKVVDEVRQDVKSLVADRRDRGTTD